MAKDKIFFIVFVFSFEGGTMKETGLYNDCVIFVSKWIFNNSLHAGDKHPLKKSQDAATY